MSSSHGTSTTYCTASTNCRNSAQKDRAVSTVLDVGLALIFLSVAIAVVAGVATVETEEDHEPLSAPQTAEVVTTTTFSVTHSVEPALETVTPDHGYAEEELTRVTHGTVVSHLADVAVMDAMFGETPVGEPTVSYRQRLDDKLQARLVESSFQTNVTAVWKPFEESAMRGTVAVGQSPPPDADVSTATVFVPSGFDTPTVGSRPQTVESSAETMGLGTRTEKSHDAPDEPFLPIATALAETLVEGQVPTLETQRTLERSGVDRDLTEARYRALARLAGLDTEGPAFESALEPHTADAERLNEMLVDAFLEPQGQDVRAALEETFDEPSKATAALQPEVVTITIRTWDA